jgi:hypothetical protein
MNKGKGKGYCPPHEGPKGKPGGGAPPGSPTRPPAKTGKGKKK